MVKCLALIKYLVNKIRSSQYKKIGIIAIAVGSSVYALPTPFRAKVCLEH